MFEIPHLQSSCTCDINKGLLFYLVWLEIDGFRWFRLVLCPIYQGSPSVSPKGHLLTQVFVWLHGFLGACFRDVSEACTDKPSSMVPIAAFNLVDHEWSTMSNP